MTHATPTELILRAQTLEREARWATGRDWCELRDEAALLRKLAEEAQTWGVVAVANDNCIVHAMPASRGKEVAA